MSSQEYKAGQEVKCPHCGKPQDGPVEDMVVPGPHGRLNHPYENDCGWCDRLYDVMKLDDERYTVTPKPGSR